jgi:hypothetical protein
VAERKRVPVFERRTLTISVTPIVETIAGDDCGSLTCGYCSGGCTNCTATCRGAASTKHLQVFDPLEEVELNADEILKVVSEMLESVNEQRG